MSESRTSEPEENVILIEDSEALRLVLGQHGFAVDQWGQGPTKSVEALWEEVAEGETEMVETGGRLVRRTHVAAVDVTAKISDGSKYKLREDKQVFKNGSERHRFLITSLGEKIKPHESTDMAVRRAIKEELNIGAPINIIEKGEQLIEKGSQTFSGLLTELKLRFAEVEISEADFRPEGYVEHQLDKSVYFVWEPVE